MVRTETIRAKTLPEEKAALIAIARQDRRNPSEALRELVRKEAVERGIWPPKLNGGRA